MRIGFDAKRAYHNNTGLGNYSRDLIRGMSEAYPEEDLLLFTPKTSNNPRIAFAEQSNNIRTITPSQFIHQKIGSYWRSSGIHKDLLKNKVDLYHGLSNELPFQKTTSYKRIVTIHDLIFLRHPETYKAIDRKTYTRKFEFASKYADRVIAISEQTKKDLIDFFKIPEQQIEVVYQSCHDQFKQEVSEERKQEVRQTYGLPDQFVLYVGTIEQRKNLHALIEACANIDIPIVAVGRKTNYFNTVMESVNRHRMNTRVLFLEGIPFVDLPAIYQQANLFCYPSVFEGFGIPIIEALYSKIPVLTSEGGVFPETGGPHSAYVNPNDIGAISEQVQTLLTDSTLREQMISGGFDFVQKFSTANFVKDTYSVYQKVL